MLYTVQGRCGLSPCLFIFLQVLHLAGGVARYCSKASSWRQQLPECMSVSVLPWFCSFKTLLVHYSWWIFCSTRCWSIAVRALSQTSCVADSRLLVFWAGGGAENFQFIKEKLWLSGAGSVLFRVPTELVLANCFVGCCCLGSDGVEEELNLLLGSLLELQGSFSCLKPRGLCSLCILVELGFQWHKEAWFWLLHGFDCCSCDWSFDLPKWWLVSFNYHNCCMMACEFLIHHFCLFATSFNWGFLICSSSYVGLGISTCWNVTGHDWVVDLIIPIAACNYLWFCVLKSIL